MASKPTAASLALIAEVRDGKDHPCCTRLMEELHDSARTVFLFQTQCDSREFFCYVSVSLHRDRWDGPRGDAQELKPHSVLTRCWRAGAFASRGRSARSRRTHARNDKAPFRFETTHAKLLEIVLAGQPQLAEKLAQRGLSQLRQRIAIFGHLEPLSVAEIACYIEHRLKVAGLIPAAPLFGTGCLWR